MSYYPLYGNVFVDSSNNGGLGGTLSITNSCNTGTLGNQASIAFDVANVSPNILGTGFIQSGVDTAGARISAVIDRVVPAVGTAVVMSVTGNSLQPPAEAMRISSNGNIGIGIQAPQYSLDVSNTGIRATSILSSGLKTTTVVSITNPTNIAASDFVIGQGTSSTATTVYGQKNIFIGNPPTALTTSATYNVGLGNQALTSLTTGTYNVAVGYQAGNAITTGAYNTAIGANAFTGASTYNYSTAIGYNAQITGNNQLVLGTSAETVKLPGGINMSNSSTLINVSGTITLSNPLAQIYPVYNTSALSIQMPSPIIAGAGTMVWFRRVTGAAANVTALAFTGTSIVAYNNITGISSITLLTTTQYMSLLYSDGSNWYQMHTQ
jgi:hypothetical protein